MVQLEVFFRPLSRQSEVHSIDNECIDLHVVMYRLVHAFTSAGVLPSQYKRMSMFAKMGVVGKGYIDRGLSNFIHC